jgi:hypothetical protein
MVEPGAHQLLWMYLDAPKRQFLETLFRGLNSHVKTLNFQHPTDYYISLLKKYMFS